MADFGGFTIRDGNYEKVGNLFFDRPKKTYAVMTYTKGNHLCEEWKEAFNLVKSMGYTISDYKEYE